MDKLYFRRCLAVGMFFATVLGQLAFAGQAQGDDLWGNAGVVPEPGSFADEVKALNVTLTPDGWFEVVELPGNVYGFMEHGHSERVNSFWIPGEHKDILYDTGMGIASIRNAVDYIRDLKGLPDHEIMVINSHAHLDHIGGNSEFETVHIFEDEWSVRTLTNGIEPGAWSEYYSALLPIPAPRPPEHFDPNTHFVEPFALKNIRFLKDGELIDLGNRKFRVIQTSSHTSSDLLLYNEEEQLLFTGDAFTPIGFLVSNLEQFEQDVGVMSGLAVKYHYNTHGPALIDTSWRKKVYEAAKRVNAGEYTLTMTSILGLNLPTYASGDVHNIIDAVELLSQFP